MSLFSFYSNSELACCLASQPNGAFRFRPEKCLNTRRYRRGNNESLQWEFHEFLKYTMWWWSPSGTCCVTKWSLK